MFGRHDRHQRTPQLGRRLEFESLESRIVLSAAGVVEPATSYVAAGEALPVANVAPIDTPITELTFQFFELLTPAQIPLLSPAQVATIPDSNWFSRIPAASRAAFTQPQIQALRVAAVRINLLTPQQVGWLTTSHIQSLSHFDFEYLAPGQIPTLTTAQIASIPDSGTFTEWSAAARAALTVPQVQALKVATVRLHLLTATQISWLTTAQIQSVDHFDFKFLNVNQTPLLTQAQIASIPDIGSFGAWSPAARAALTAAQVPSLNVAAVYIELLTAQQAAWLTAAQVRSLPQHQFPLLSASQTPLLTPAQIATIPDVGAFGMWSAAARAALTAEQVQALDVRDVRLILLTPTQVTWISAAQIQSLLYYDFYLLNSAQTPWLTPAQIASIPNIGSFGAWSAAARAALTAAQVPSLNVATVYIELLTVQQTGWLTAAQVRSLPQHQFRYLPASHTPLLTPAQIATIPNVGAFGMWSAAARAALTAEQVQALDVRDVRLILLTPTQVTWISAAQIQSLLYYDFYLLNSAQTPWLTPAQIASIPNIGSFGAWSAAARAALTAAQVPALNVTTVYIELLTAQQTGWLTAAQVRSLPQHQFRYLPASHTPLLTPAQIATIPNVGAFGMWSAAARAALTAEQVQALDVRDVRLILLTPTQVTWISAAQIQSVLYYDFYLLNSAQTPWLTPAQIASIPNIGSFGAWSAAARAALTAAQVPALNVTTVYIELLTAQQAGWLSAAQVRALPQQQFRYLPASQIPLLTLAQVDSIPTFGVFSEWSPAARGALTIAQVQSLNIAALGIELLTPQQIVWLTTAQVRSLAYQQFRYLGWTQIPLLTTTQIASMPDVGPIASWSAISRAFLTFSQIRALSAGALRLDLLTSTQIGWLTTAQIQSRASSEFVMLYPGQIPLLTTQQMASVPDNYNLRLWTDEAQAALTRAQLLALPYAVLNTHNGLFPELVPPSNYVPVIAGHNHAAHEAEAAQVMILVPVEAATHRTVASGNWSDPSIWSGGVVPGLNANALISAGTYVRFDAFMNTPIFTLRVDGTLDFATNLNTQLKADTIVVNEGGVLHIGTAENPIGDNVTAKVLIANNGPINASWDPYNWSRGLVSRGEVRMVGRSVAAYATLAVNPKIGNTTLYFNGPLTGWRVGDEIAIAGTNAYTLDFNADRVRIRAINGSVVTVDPIRYNHDVPAGLGLSLYVANLTRNIQFAAENSAVIAQRPHIAFIHNPDVDIQNVSITGFGRTNKSLPINSPVVVNGVVQPGTGTNPRARYALHFHHTGVDPMMAPARVNGSVVDGSPGWGYVNHSSNVEMSFNVAFGVVGASFVSEDGNEIGKLFGNLSMNALGALTPENILARYATHDFGHEGYGFWFQGPGIEATYNVSAGSHDGGFVFMTQSSKTLFDAVNLDDPAMAAGHAAVPVGSVPLKKFEGNLSFTAETGLEIWHHMTLMTDGESLIKNFTSWNTRLQGIDLHYAGHVTFDNIKLYGDLSQYTGVGVISNRLTHDINFNNMQIIGFEIGIQVPVRRRTQINGGAIFAVQGIYIEKGHDTIRTVTVGGGLQLNKPTAAQLHGRTYYSVYATAEHSFEYPSFADRRIDSMFSDDVISISINGGTPGRLYFYEQSASYVVFPASTSTSEVPAGYLNKTNAQLAAEFGVALGGELVPSSAVQVPEVYGLMRYRFAH